MPVVVLLVERALRGKPAGALAFAAATAAMVSWLHPWQGVTLALVLGGLAGWPGQLPGAGRSRWCPSPA